MNFITCVNFSEVNLIVLYILVPSCATHMVVRMAKEVCIYPILVQVSFLVLNSVFTDGSLLKKHADMTLITS